MDKELRSRICFIFEWENTVSSPPYTPPIYSLQWCIVWAHDNYSNFLKHITYLYRVHVSILVPIFDNCILSCFLWFLLSSFLTLLSWGLFKDKIVHDPHKTPTLELYTMFGIYESCGGKEVKLQV
jgi:hypothetical protein